MQCSPVRPVVCLVAGLLLAAVAFPAMPAPARVLAQEDEAARWTQILLTAPVDRFQSPISDFPGPILLPTTGDGLFAGLPLITASASDAGMGGRGNTAYGVVIGHSENDRIAMFTGQVGHELFEQWGERREGCGPTSTYCTIPGLGPGARPAGEHFYGYEARGWPAVVLHSLCCDGEHWTVIWYDGDEDITYNMSLFPGLAGQIGAPKQADAANRRYAPQLIDIVDALITVRFAQ